MLTSASCCPSPSEPAGVTGATSASSNSSSRTTGGTKPATASGPKRPERRRSSAPKALAMR